MNGAGLAMATMDLVKYYGGEPANFLDIGGSSNPEKVVNALKIITADRGVKAILFNIFGGITRTDDVANGIVAATRQFTVNVPIVIRLTGTNEEQAFEILKGVGMRALSDMDEAVKQAVQLAKEAVSIFVNADTRLVVQGITGRDGSFHTRQMMEYGTRVVAGVTPGKGGRRSKVRCRSFTPSRMRSKDGAAYLGHLRPACDGGRGDRRGRRRRDRVHRLHHGRHSGPGHGEGQCRSSGRRAPACWVPTVPD